MTLLQTKKISLLRAPRFLNPLQTESDPRAVAYPGVDRKKHIIIEPAEFSMYPLTADGYNTLVGYLRTKLRFRAEAGLQTEFSLEKQYDQPKEYGSPLTATNFGDVVGVHDQPGKKRILNILVYSQDFQGRRAYHIPAKKVEDSEWRVEGAVYKQFRERLLDAGGEDEDDGEAEEAQN